ncbi:hypothetical protein B0H13DRAFT_1880261 [Mycena leptocephala]|nr:hypothetical protein B0H13DRAFT_1880261 [Mycena leptocephala]
MEPGKAVDTGRLQNIRVYWLAFLVYWVSFLFFYSMQVGIVLFGYNTGIAGGVVPQPLFRSHFGLLDANGYPITSKTNAISSKPARSSAAPISAIIDHREQTHPGALHAHLPPRCRTHHCGRTASRSSTRATSSTASSAALSAFVSECSPKKAKGCSRLRSLCGDDWLFS